MFLVISVAPLGLIGVVMALLPTGTPMGFVATLLTLLFLPALYVAWFRIKEPHKEPEPRLRAGVPAPAK